MFQDIKEEKKLPSDKSDGNIYQTFEVFKFQLPNKAKHHLQSAVLENRNDRPAWGIDAMLIDEELLYLEDAEADRVYLELKARSDCRRKMEARQNRLSA